MAAEQWDLYDANGQRTGQVMTRGEAVPNGLYHLAVHIWPQNRLGQFLVQRRAPSVQWKPNLWAVTGGSAIRGEDPRQAACRELFEEIGYRAQPHEFKQLAYLRRTNSFCAVFTLRIDWPVERFVLQKEEVSAVQWCDFGKLMRMVAENNLYNYGDAYFKMLQERSKL